ncbi:unnamed protein product [Brassica napus]|uniref:(rape) hypothetical protein n=1 Tax=Brassica napus TaxID=3708 RepID=A0A816UVP5_BRANA|nr:unnamed protein product [Brassica napus]
MSLQEQATSLTSACWLVGDSPIGFITYIFRDLKKGGEKSFEEAVVELRRNCFTFPPNFLIRQRETRLWVKSPTNKKKRRKEKMKKKDQRGCNCLSCV